MRKLLLCVLLLALACTDNPTDAPVKQRPPRCVVPPLPGNSKQAVPILPDISQDKNARSPFLSMRYNGQNSGQIAVDFKVLVLLVDFPDKPFRESPAYFDDLFFADTGKTFKTYYGKESYGAFNAVSTDRPSRLFHASHPYSYYTNSNYGFGAFPTNAQGLALEIAQLADPVIDFSQYDNDGDGFVDGFVLIHAGSGAELTGSVNDIWSHQWSFPALTVDGKTITDYCTAPEYWTDTRQMQIGVIVHEAGHLYFNQLDEYGTCGTWQGLGRHCCMATGSYNGRTGLGDQPAPFCAPSKVRAGFATPVPIDTPGYYAVPMGKVLRYGTATENIYVEQAQRVDFDQPGSGLRFIHGKATSAGMCYRWYPPLNADVDGWGLYQIIQADGLYEMEKNLSSGDAEDYWPGLLGKTVLDSTTSPTSNWYSGTTGKPSGFNLSQITSGGFVFGRTAPPPPPPPDTITCPGDMLVVAGKNKTGKAVFYTGPGDCTPPTGSFFPIGVTTVNCGTCTFTITVVETGKDKR